MESGEDDLVDIFADEELNENEANEEQDNQESNDTSTRVKVAAPKRIVKNPRLKFNAERLCGERGIPIVVDHFKNVKFKGKGHEKEDLNKLLSHLELWTHRLFPSMKFEECLRHIEKLGKKRQVQTCLRKIRLDMPILNNDFIQNDDDDDDVKRNDDPEPPTIEDAFDSLLKESSQDLLSSNVNNLENYDFVNTSYSSQVVNKDPGQMLGTEINSTLTEEQKERMQRNRMLAAERRKARLSGLQSNASISAQESAVNPQMSSAAFDDLFDEQNSVKQKNFDTNNSSVAEDNINNENSALLSNEQSSEQLGLDDLVDLVDEGPDSSKTLLDEQKSEQLGLDDLVDLVDDEESDSPKELLAESIKSHKNFTVNLEMEKIAHSEKSLTGSSETNKLDVTELPNIDTTEKEINDISINAKNNSCVESSERTYEENIFSEISTKDAAHDVKECNDDESMHDFLKNDNDILVTENITSKNISETQKNEEFIKNLHEVHFSTESTLNNSKTADDNFDASKTNIVSATENKAASVIGSHSELSGEFSKNIVDFGKNVTNETAMIIEGVEIRNLSNDVEIDGASDVKSAIDKTKHPLADENEANDNCLEIDELMELVED